MNTTPLPRAASLRERSRPARRDPRPGSAACLVLALGFAPPALALEDTYFGELPIVLSVSRLSQSLHEAPGAVTVLDRELIRRSGARTLAELLRLVPGFQVAANEYGAPVATYHGPVEEFPQGLQVLIDGRSQYSPASLGGVNWNALPIILEDVERIEVTRGSNSASYGSNAFLGIVNVITRHASTDPGVVLEKRLGGGGIADEYARFGGSHGPLSYRLSYLGQKDEGLPGSFDTLRQRQLHLRSDLTIGNRDELTLLAGSLQGELAIDGTDPIIDPPRFPRPHDQTYLQAQWRRVLGEDSDLQLRYYHVIERGGERFDIDIDRYVEREFGIPRPGLGIGLAPIDNRYRSVRDDVELQHSFRPDPRWRMVWGLGWRHDKLGHDQNFFALGDLGQTVRRIFGNAEWNSGERWLANLGGTWEDDSNSGTTFAPRATLHLRIAPEHTLRLGLSTAYRTPSLYEQKGREFYRSYGGMPLDWVYAATHDLDPEHVISQEIGYIGELPRLGLTLEARLSRERIHDGLARITLPAPEAFATALEGTLETSANGLEADVDAFEYSLQWRPQGGTRLIFNQAFLNISGRLGGDAASAANRALIERQLHRGGPSHSASLTWLQDLPCGLKLSASYRSVDGMQWTNGQFFAVGQYGSLDARLAYPFRGRWGSGEFALAVRDYGADHEEFRRTEFVEPRTYASLRLSF